MKESAHVRKGAMAMIGERRRRPEIMDQPDLDPAAHERALAGLARINRFSGSARILWPALERLSRELRRPLRVLDLATGGGDIPIRLWHMARRLGLDWDVQGWDVSPVAVEHARRLARQVDARVTFCVRDALQGPAPSGFDAVTCSLFLHHLDEGAARDLLRRMAGLDGGAAEPARLVLVNDLERSLVGLALAHLGGRLLTTSPVVHFDGPRSVEGAFTVAEARALATQAELHGVVIRRCWPFRYLLAWRRA
jgi:SAM-dependent methyltransferase